MTEDAWEIRCFWKPAAGGSPVPWTTRSSHTCEQQARSAAQKVFDTYQCLGPMTIDAVEMRGPTTDWRRLLTAVAAAEQVPRFAGRPPRR